MKSVKALETFVIACSLLVSQNIYVAGNDISPASRKVAISRAREIFVATAKADIPTLKKLTTADFYKEHYPYSDDTVRELLLSVPYERRQKMIDQILNHCEVTTIANRAGDVITVILTNKITNKAFTVRLIDEYANGDWKIFEYEY